MIQGLLDLEVKADLILPAVVEICETWEVVAGVESKDFFSYPCGQPVSI